MVRLMRATEMAHALVRERVSAGDLVVDATVGNGHDTVFLAGLVGEGGSVVGFDVQAAAIAATRERVDAAGVGGRVELLKGSHADLAEHIDREVGGVMFNLGYLPGGDHTVVTTPEPTVAALTAAAESLRRGGILTCVVYPGHAGGAEEAEAVSAWFRRLGQEEFAVVHYGFENQRNSPPFLLAAERRG